MKEIQDLILQELIDFYHYKSKTSPKIFLSFKDPLKFYKNIKEKG